jgi:hypothetical protein
MKNRFLLILLFTVAAALAVVAVPRFQESKDQLSAKQALALVRTVSSTEASLKYKASGYGSLHDVIELAQLDKSWPLVSLDSSSATVKDYRIAVMVAADGQHFQVSMHPTTGCGVSFFTNESGVIYQGLALGCPTP